MARISRRAEPTRPARRGSPGRSPRSMRRFAGQRAPSRRSSRVRRAPGVAWTPGVPAQRCRRAGSYPCVQHGARIGTRTGRRNDGTHARLTQHRNQSQPRPYSCFPLLGRPYPALPVFGHAGQTDRRPWRPASPRPQRLPSRRRGPGQAVGIGARRVGAGRHGLAGWKRTGQHRFAAGREHDRRPLAARSKSARSTSEPGARGFRTFLPLALRWSALPPAWMRGGYAPSHRSRRAGLLYCAGTRKGARHHLAVTCKPVRPAPRLAASQSAIARRLAASRSAPPCGQVQAGLRRLAPSYKTDLAQDSGDLAA